MRSLLGLALLFLLSACGADRAVQQGSATLEEAYQRGFSGTVACQRQRNLARMGFAWDPAACPPVQ